MPRLVLEANENDGPIFIGEHVKVTVIRARGKRAVLAFDADASIPIYREKVVAKVARELAKKQKEDKSEDQ
jgi:sRNA-binding carbon storage regulator CsrA